MPGDGFIFSYFQADVIFEIDSASFSMPGIAKPAIDFGAGTVVLDPFNGDPDETHHPEAAWYALATVSARARHLGE